MTTQPDTFWDRLPLRLKGALIVGAPVVALLLGALTTFWMDRQSDRVDALERQAARARTIVDDVANQLNEAAGRLQAFALSEDPDDLPKVDGSLLRPVRAMGRLEDPRTGEAYPGLAQTSATVREALLRVRFVAAKAASGSDEDDEDALEYLAERLATQAEHLEIPLAEAEAAERTFAREIASLDRRESATYLLVLLGGLVGGIAAVGFFARSFTKRISDLGTAAEHLAAGNFSRPFPRGSDEIGVLGARLYGAFADLRRSEERGALILETSSDAYIAMDADWTVTGWNRAAESIFGWTKEEAVGRNSLGLVVPREHHRAYDAGRDAFLATGKLDVIERRIETTGVHKDGRILPVELSVVPIEQDGSVTFHSFVRDLTERKKAEREVADRTLRMADIIQTMNQMTTADLDLPLLHRVLLDRAVSMTKADGAALQMESNGKLVIVAGTGPAESHVGGKLDVDRSMTGAALKSGRTLVSGDLTQHEAADHTFAKTVGAVSAITVPLVHDDRVVGVLAVHSGRKDAFGEAETTDIELLGGFFGAVIGKIHAHVAREVVVRERTEALEELRVLHAELEAKNAALVEATAEATAANRAKSEFLSRMSHELRTPLNAILGFAQLLQSDALDEDQADSVAHIVVAGRHLLGLINEVLDIARIESGGTPVTLRAVVVSPLVREAVDLVRPLAADRSIALTIAPLPDAACAWADEQKVKQILLNLLSNAVKYNRDGGRIEVRVADSSHAIHVSVTDTGAGIPPEKVASLFTPFDRLGAERTEIEGTGLGLAVSQKLAEAMGGSLSLSTKSGSGSTFTLTLETSEPGHPQSAQASPPASRGTPARHHSVKVVYVEDDASNARLVTRALKTAPEVELHVAADGRTGLELVAKLHPALVLLDLNLPDEDGLAVLRLLREGEATASIPVVVLSADATPEQMRASLDAGADGYLTKPVDLAELTDSIRRFARPAAVTTA